MSSNNLNIQNLRHYGIHGALGLLMGAGIGTILLLFFGMIFSSYFIVFTVFGVYMGYIFEKEKEYFKLGVIAGIFSGGAASLLGTILIETNGDITQIATNMIVLGIAGLIFGLPKARSMVLLAVSGVLGGMVGTGIYIFGKHLTYFLKDMGTQQHFGDIFFLAIILIMLLLSILAIATAGASLSLGMFIADGMVYSKKEIPGSLKIIRNLCIGLIILVLLFFTLMFSIIADYASSATSIHVSSDTGEMTLYVPVLLDDKGNVLEMYEHPEVTGDTTTAIIDTKYGKALKINRLSGDVGINMRQSHGIQLGKQLEEVFDGFSISMSDYTVGKDVQMTDIRIYSATEVNNLSISLSLDNGWGKINTIETEQNIDLSEGWQVVRLSVSNMWYD
ncbi:MAG: hypothetical protein K8R25_13365 [Methanosarcinales archaeon]|nr:hypothetical protein [Methanosarcinales archaeon]